MAKRKKAEAVQDIVEEPIRYRFNDRDRADSLILDELDGFNTDHTKLTKKERRRITDLCFMAALLRLVGERR